MSMAPPISPRSRLAADPDASRGRLIAEAPSPTRTVFQRDRDRIVHSTAFRRLAHKTQVFVHHEGDHFRTRLTHTIEVAQLARALAKPFGLDEDLTEAVALGHDLGHTPFGHAGEDALDACLADLGGFDHNSHGLRLVTELERHYADFDGLNLSAETIEGLVKHNGPLLDAQRRPLPRWAARGVPAAILAYDAKQSLQLSEYASLEAQAAAIADDIAYNAHDIDDGLRAGLFTLEEIADVAYLAGLIEEIERRHPGLEPSRRIHELSRRVITRFVEDAMAETARRISEDRIETGEDARRAGRALFAFSTPMAAAEREIKAFLFQRMYRAPEVNRMRAEADKIVRALHGAYAAEPEEMPPFWAAHARAVGPARASADYLAGMTDRFALNEYRRRFDPEARLR
jgi:dGTPase